MGFWESIYTHTPWHSLHRHYISRKRSLSSSHLAEAFFLSVFRRYIIYAWKSIDTGSTTMVFHLEMHSIHRTHIQSRHTMCKLHTYYIKQIDGRGEAMLFCLYVKYILSLRGPYRFSTWREEGHFFLCVECMLSLLGTHAHEYTHFTCRHRERERQGIVFLSV